MFGGCVASVVVARAQKWPLLTDDELPEKEEEVSQQKGE